MSQIVAGENDEFMLNIGCRTDVYQ